MKIFLTCSLFLISYGLNAQTLEDAQHCTNIEKDVARLACYDHFFETSSKRVEGVVDAQTGQGHDANAMGTAGEMGSPPQRMDSPTAAKSVTNEVSATASAANQSARDLERTSDKQQINSAESAFGAEGLAIDKFSQGLSRIDAVIGSLSQNSRNIRTFTLENGQVWQETESSRLRLKAGMNIYIEKGLLSAHFLGIEDSNRRVRVKRIQ
jgi:hypothetical protein